MNEIGVNAGFVRLVDCMPRENLDSSIVQAARVSYAEGTKTSRSDEGLIRYLLRHWHTTPFEMVDFKFHIKMPIFVARQHLRHRTASVNEMSARYSVVPDEYFVPEEYRMQSRVNKQGSEGVLDLEQSLKESPTKSCSEAFGVYQKLLDSGCCRELARCHLPQSTYTEFYWKINLHNLMHYLQLRMEDGAQKEIRDYANAIYDLVAPLAPLTMKAFRDFRLNNMQLSAIEIDCIKNNYLPESIGEKREFVAKLDRLGLSLKLFPNGIP
jgi:thymidylate synthase (FAD)